MFPIAHTFTMAVIVGSCCIGLLLGAGTGFLSSLALELQRRGIWKDAILGLIAVPIGFILVSIIPVPQHTVYARIGNWQTQQAAQQFQHPLVLAFILAATLPICRNVWRFRHQRRDSRDRCC